MILRIDDGNTLKSLSRFFGSIANSPTWSLFVARRDAVFSATICLILIFTAVFAPIIAPQDPFDLATLDLFEAFTPPAWMDGGSTEYLLGSDDQGRDVLSAMMYGMRTSLIVGFSSLFLSMFIGVSIGLISGYGGGLVDSILMRIADIQLSFPGILIALIVDGVARAALPAAVHRELAIFVLIAAIGLSHWVPFARTVRGAVFVQKSKEYVQSAMIIGRSPTFITVRHILPNILGPIIVLATINLAISILNEATLSYLGVGMPPDEPSLGTLINTGQNFLFSGEWWLVIFPGLTLGLLIISINMIGDWLRDSINPKIL
jgi:peptide/nickel transport system permease protein